MSFVPFYFESNACWGFVSNKEDWEAMKIVYFSSYKLVNIDEQQVIYKARMNENRSPAMLNDYKSFGFYREYDSDIQLKDFFLTNNMLMD